MMGKVTGKRGEKGIREKDRKEIIEKEGNRD
jgi:hypothetical protein